MLPFIGAEVHRGRRLSTRDLRRRLRVLAERRHEKDGIRGKTGATSCGEDEMHVSVKEGERNAVAREELRDGQW